LQKKNGEKKESQMNKNSNQDSTKEIIELIKGDYNSPVKLWAWGKAINEWGGIILGGIIVFIVLLLLLAAIGSSLKDQEKNKSQQTASLPMKEIVTYLALLQRSINERQMAYKHLMYGVDRYEKYKQYSPNQKELEEIIQILTDTAKSCNSTRGSFINNFTETKNPFEDLKISADFDKLIEHKDIFDKDKNVLEFQLENEQWAALCTLCQEEVKKVSNELAQLLKRGGSAQPVE